MGADIEEQTELRRGDAKTVLHLAVRRPEKGPVRAIHEKEKTGRGHSKFHI